ncbi:hypothetical protein N7495_005280 [Penicillium taxi]|uniref:uncharacterized protein n=1 Tax=Penicillium taxi TaxID=168475 RepID=UPI002545B958|nr:uncharacterized protein N7495_005280 [Penicillium taxi]KAJ5893589.1 hypothetical protein N7495_005280 [Penicillium taxi]
MRPPRTVRFQRPPPPSVEEEPVSLSRELNGLNKLGEKPGVEGTCARGAVDQYPIILTADSSTSASPPIANVPGMGNVSSDDNSNGPRTPPLRSPEYVERVDSKSHRRSRTSESGGRSSRSKSIERPRHQEPGVRINGSKSNEHSCISDQSTRPLRSKSIERPRNSEPVGRTSAPSKPSERSRVPEPEVRIPRSRSIERSRRPEPVGHTSDSKLNERSHHSESSVRASDPKINERSRAQEPEVRTPRSKSSERSRHSQPVGRASDSRLNERPRHAEPTVRATGSKSNHHERSRAPETRIPRSQSNERPRHSEPSRTFSSKANERSERPPRPRSPPSSGSSKPRERHHSTRDSFPIRSRPHSLSLSSGNETVYITINSARGSESDKSHHRGRVHSKDRSSFGRSNSGRHSASVARPVPDRSERPRSETIGYMSDSAAARSRSISQHQRAQPAQSTQPAQSAQPAAVPTVTENLPVENPPRIPTLAERVEERLRSAITKAPEVPQVPTLAERVEERLRLAGAKLPRVPTLSERLEEKLSLRHARHESGSHSDTEAPSRAPDSPSRGHHVSSLRSQERLPTSRPRATSVTSGTAPPHAVIRTLTSNTAPASRAPSTTRTTSRSKSPDNTLAVSTRSSREPSTQRSIPGQSALVQYNQPQKRAQNVPGIYISPCPRTTPLAGYEDWYTLKGLTHIDICPSCMSQIAHSRFRDLFIPSLAKPPTEAVSCVFSIPWNRLAWTQMIQKQHDSLEMLYQMTRPPPGTNPCSGRIITEQTWYRVLDPDTGAFLPRFHICSSCARNVRVLMPSHRDTFQPCEEPQERVCDFATTSPRFVQYIDLLDTAASRAEADPTRRPESREFLSYARRKVVLRDCSRDKPIMSTWHYITALPELSVCEDCYDDVVWPLAKAHHPIARMFSTSMRLLPGDGPNRCREATCQLYSPRMRTRLRDAVRNEDFESLKSISLRRFEAERRFKDRTDELLEAEKKGFDCKEEMKKAEEEWKRWE